MSRPRYPIGSVDHALSLLSAVEARRTLGAAQAASLAGVSRPTAYRLLSKLAQHGLVQRDPVSGGYVPGPALVQLGLAAARSLDLRTRLQPKLARVVDEVGETAHLVTLRGASALFLDCAESPRALRAGSRTGSLLPANCTAGGKVLLAELELDELRRLFGERLPALTARSLTDLDVLVQQLATIRRRGYATNLSESEEELNAVAVVVRGRQGDPVAAITAAGPRFRLRESQLAEVARRMRAVLAGGPDAVVQPGRRSIARGGER